MMMYNYMMTTSIFMDRVDYTAVYDVDIDV